MTHSPEPRRSPAAAARELGSFLDAQGILTQWPVKRHLQRAAVFYLVAKFERGRRYSEPEVTQTFDQWTRFRDAARLRRTMVEEDLLSRTADGREYWLS